MTAFPPTRDHGRARRDAGRADGEATRPRIVLTTVNALVQQRAAARRLRRGRR
jgi:hypothetical protein